MPNARTGTVLCSSLSRFRTHIEPLRFHIPDYDNEKMGPKFCGVFGAFPGKATVLSYRLYYYLFFDFPSSQVIDHVDGNTEHNIYWNLEPVTIAENTLKGLQRVQNYVGQAVRCRKSEDVPWTSFVNAECAVLDLQRQYPLLTCRRPVPLRLTEQNSVVYNGSGTLAIYLASGGLSTRTKIFGYRTRGGTSCDKEALRWRPSATTLYPKGQGLGASLDTGFPKRAPVHPSGPGRRLSATIPMASRARVRSWVSHHVDNCS